ncbi:MAG: ester cyclase [Nitrospira sp.]|nr:ester cyclase [Nitrospira sp.]
MKAVSVILAPMVVLLVATAALAETVAEKNKKLVRDFYELAFNQHRPTEAAKKYIGEQYIQHNPNVPNGAEAFYGFFEGFFKEHPKSHVDIKRILADGDLVALHLHSKVDENDPGLAIIDIFRVENGKIVEHWDVIQPVPEKAANSNTMF